MQSLVPSKKRDLKKEPRRGGGVRRQGGEEEAGVRE